MVTQNSCTDTSECISFTAGLDDDMINANLKVYPNPGSGEYMVELGRHYEKTEVIILDISGQVVQNKVVFNTNQIQLNLEEASGIYQLILTTSSGQTARTRLIKE